MIRFESDYLEGALPEIMARLQETNYVQTAGYGVDPYCDAAREKIKAACEAENADVHFLVGGTQTNTTVIAAALRPHQGVLAAESAHIEAHETGAIEATGHKVLTLPSLDGKIRAEQVREYVLRHRADESFEHIVQPAMVYISQPTETGTVYSFSELKEISKTCRELGILLFVDGARLACALSLDYTPTLQELAELTDVFYIGGTKHGALFGEAVVILNEDLKKDFRYMIKQRGGMFAKGRLLGIQFEALFTDELYFKTGAHEMRLADKLRSAFSDKGIEFYYNSPTNQLFPVLNDAQLEKLSAKYSFSLQKRLDDGHTVTRFCTSWASREEDIDGLISDINAL
ncbi:MAG: aminotransferase class V-fold PLP-dependent enzyme [Bacillota bacterium]|nr:aminotransferase class V-fold PLP-dependent enzyme [Bacillota bacterium]